MDQMRVFEQIYQEYLEQIRKLDLAQIAPRLGLLQDGEGLVVPFFGLPHRVSGRGILDPEGLRPIHSVSVVLAKYLILCPEGEPSGSQWVTYREFKDAAPFVGGFSTHAERPIAEAFAGRLPQLRDGALRLAGRVVETEVRADLALCFQALPRVPILMLFNDQDEDFPAQCSLLFENKTDKHLDMECLAMMGWVLAAWLRSRH